jgi:hypothetical protein
MIRWNALVVGAALILVTGGIALQAKTPAQNSTTKTTTTPTMHHEMGTVDSMTNSELILSHEYKGKSETTTFVLNASTKKDGTIDKGQRVEVYYQNQNKQHIATEVKAEPKSS